MSAQHDVPEVILLIYISAQKYRFSNKQRTCNEAYDNYNLCIKSAKLKIFSSEVRDFGLHYTSLVILGNYNNKN